MKKFTAYDPANGKIKFNAEVPEEFYHLQAVSKVEGEYSGEDFYVNGGIATPRPNSPITRTGDTLQNVPAGSQMYIENDVYSASGTVNVTFSHPGTYEVEIESFPYRAYKYFRTVSGGSGGGTGGANLP